MFILSWLVFNFHILYVLTTWGHMYASSMQPNHVWSSSFRPARAVGAGRVGGQSSPTQKNTTPTYIGRNWSKNFSFTRSLITTSPIPRIPDLPTALVAGEVCFSWVNLCFGIRFYFVPNAYRLKKISWENCASRFLLERITTGFFMAKSQNLII